METVWSVVETVKVSGQRVGEFLQRHRKKAIAVAVIGGTTFLIIRFAKYKLRQFQLQIEMQEKALTKMRMQSYFESAQKSCDNSVLGFIEHSLRDKLIEVIEIPSTSQLRTSTLQATTEQKKALWEKVKTATFARTITGLYASVLFTLFVRVEVNILGRYLYMDNSISDDAQNGDARSISEEKPISDETKKKFLSFAEYMLNRGIVQLANDIHAKIEEEMVNWPITKKCTFDDIINLLSNIRARIEGPLTPSSNSSISNNKEPSSSPVSTSIDSSHPNVVTDETSISRSSSNSSNLSVNEFSFHQYLLPAEDEASKQALSEQLNCLLNETRDVLESEKFSAAFKSCLDRGYQFLAAELAAGFHSTVQTPHDPTAVLPMPKIIPLVKEQYYKFMELSQDAHPLNVDSSQVSPAAHNVNFLNILFGLRELEDYSYYIFTSSYDEE